MKKNTFLKNKRVNDRYDLFFLSLYTLVSGAVFFFILYFYVPSDMGAHIQILLNFLEEGSFPTPPLYYASVYLLHFIMPYKEGYGMAALFILTAAGALKFYCSITYLKCYCSRVNSKYINFFTFGLMFFAPITLLIYEEEFWYLGKFTSVVWHNSTTLLSFPFCILLFIYIVLFFEDANPKWLQKIFILAIIIIFIKPSFIFAFIPAYPISILVMNRKWSTSLTWAVGLCILLFVCILFEKMVIYNLNPYERYLEGSYRSSGIGINPFFIWLYYSEAPMLDILTSFMFPFLFIFLYFRKLRNDYHFVFSSLLVAWSVLIYLTLIETGPRMLDGNFFWQIPISLLLWNLVLIKNFFQLDNFYSFSLRTIAFISNENKFLLLCFTLHVLCGVAYLGRYIIKGTYF